MMYKKRTYKRPIKRRFRKRYGASRRSIPRRMSNNVHAYKRTAELTSIQVAADTGFVPAQYTFQLSDVPEMASFVQLYTYLKLCAVRVTFYPQITVFQPADNSACPMIYTAVDYDTLNTPSSPSDLDQFNTCKRQIFNRPHTRYFKPTALGLCVGTGTTPDNFQLGRRWVSAPTGNSCPHYGLLVGIFTANATQAPAQTIRVSCMYYFKCKNVS